MSLFPSHPLYSPLPRLNPPDPPEPAPTQEDMDKLASALTEVVLLLRAGDMEGARGSLIDASGLCGVKIFGRDPLSTVPDHYLDAAIYGREIYKTMQAPPTATETLHRQKEAERIFNAKVDAIQDAMATDLLKKITEAF